MRLRLVAVALFLVGLFLCAQSPLPGFPPGVILNRGALDAASAPSFSLTYAPSSITDSTYTAGATVDYGTIPYQSGCTRIVTPVTNFAVTPTVSSATVNGVSETEASGASTGTNVEVDIWETNTSVSGTSGDVQVVWSTAPLSNSGIALYCLITTAPTAAHTAINTNSNGTSVAEAITIPSGGAGIAVCAIYNVTGTPTWTNAAADDYFTNPTITFAVAHLTASATVTCAAPGGSTNTFLSLSLASWGP